MYDQGRTWFHRTQRSGRRKRIAVASFTAAALFAPIAISAAPVANAGTVGEGFTVSPADLRYILEQIKIAEYHTAHINDAGNNGDPCKPLRDIIGNPLLSFGLRTVDGSCNNLQPNQNKWGSADQAFPRLTDPVFSPADDSNIPGIGPVGPPGQTSYAQTSGSVVDSDPRMISNLIVDQTSTNPAAVAAAGFPVRSQGNEGVEPCTSPGVPANCVPAFQSLPIDNITTDVGLSPPFNDLFTIFGQFFDHGLDKITNGNAGTVFVPLKADDPLVAGADHVFGNSDDLPANLRFMVLSRGTIVTGPDGKRSAPNTDTPFVDQSQTYTSHASHQVFLREYVNNIAGKPVSTGKFLSAPDGNGMADWAMIKAQAATMLGLKLVDMDVNNIPMLATDPYGNFIPGPNGLPQYVTTTGLVEGNLASPVPVPATGRRIDTAFLNDIAHSAAPTAAGPDSDLVAGHSLDTPAPAGTYDNELLDLHFICGDGRCNENIGLSAIHQIFHSEHDRLIDDIKNTLSTDGTGITQLAEWKNAAGADGWNGERLFQAARFVTEMEYQHLVFEEFARKVQPLINPFQAFAFNQTDVNPAITAEFAHAVYRFGHSMLTDNIPRINADGSHNDIPLLDGFLNPGAFFDGGSAGTLGSKDATTAIIMGLSDETGQEIDEFVVDTLRNNLLGLPLDLPSLNMARARSEGIPPLNEVRRQLYAGTNDGQLKPYTDWINFGEHLKHPESLVNFVAAYGHHSTITSATTLAGKRAAADQIVNGTVLPGPTADPGDDIQPPADSADFLFGTGAWASGANGVTVTGVDDIDLWMGGLAERTNLFGGLLGSTFNYVFEKQLTDLQNGDRLYYLARTPGMNLRAQLEGNSFSELVMRNTNAHTLKADPFATADCKFELGHLTGSGAPGSAITGAGSVNDDPTTADCNENKLLIRMADGTIKYRNVNSVDPAGINGQAVYNGTDGVDRIFGGVDNDTFWGGLGNDIIEGGDGADIALGGEGNDIITDLAGDDVPKGGPGNDAIDAGPGLDIVMAGDGNDFTNGGANINETFAGAGDDFVIAGQGEDGVFGDSGNDWEEGGDGPDLLIGDSSTLFFDDHNVPGNDVLIGQGGDDDYDGEGGDDVFVTGPGVEKNAGAAGWDWSIGVGDPQPQFADLNLPIVVAQPPLVEVRDKFNEVEALSGWKFDDTLIGDDVIPSQNGGGGFIGCDALDAAGIALIDGLDAVVPGDLLTIPADTVTLNTTTRYCPLQGFVWGEGNIILGGEGNDILQGRGGNDILDGDRWMNVRLSVRTDPSNPATELGTTNLMTNKATAGDFGPGTAGMTLQQAVFKGLVDPGNIVAVREIVTPPLDLGSNDIARFSFPENQYDVTPNGDGSVTVTHFGGTAIEGIDTLRNIELVQFCDVPGLVKGSCASWAAAGPVPTPPVPTPFASLSAGALFFGDQQVASTSGIQTLTIQNIGTAPLQITGVTLGGANASTFAIVNGCTALVAPADSCTITAKFTPDGTGPKAALLTITHNAFGSPELVGLVGNGTVPAPLAQVSTSTVDFADQRTGTSSAARTVTVTNTGTANLVVGGATVVGTDAASFGLSNGCAAPVLPS
ncbi:MAG: hypothetical protein RJA49_2252, partial [Actinomycetota bacterium]